jgi:ATP-dependent HslUV protease ATP-binding subunit HslU
MSNQKTRELTPKEIVEALDKYIIGQNEAKRAVAVAVRNRWRRQQLPENMRAEVGPKNILMMGPTGVGKTEIARRLAKLVNAPFCKVEATKFTEVGYHGRDVESIVRDLVDLAVHMVRQEQTEVVRQEAERLTEERLLDALLPGSQQSATYYDDSQSESEDGQKRQRTRDKFRQRLRDGELEDRDVEITAEEKSMPVGMMATIGMDQMDPEVQNFFDKLIPSQAKSRRMPIREARKVLFDQTCDQLIDREKVTEMAINRAENNGIVFLDEIDKVAATGKAHGPDVSRQGVQRDLLPIIEGCAVNTRHGVVRTDHILFIAAGAFTSSKPSDLMPELQGRLPIRVELNDLTKDDFVRILTEPQNALTRQHVSLMATEGVFVEFTEDAVKAMAEIASEVNRNMMNIGARRLYTIMEKVLEELSFNAPDHHGETITVDENHVREQLLAIYKDEDLSRFIL